MTSRLLVNNNLELITKDLLSALNKTINENKEIDDYFVEDFIKSHKEYIPEIESDYVPYDKSFYIKYSDNQYECLKQYKNYDDGYEEIYQVFIKKIASDEKYEFVIEDGKLDSIVFMSEYHTMETLQFNDEGNPYISNFSVLEHYKNDKRLFEKDVEKKALLSENVFDKEKLKHNIREFFKFYEVVNEISNHPEWFSKLKSHLLSGKWFSMEESDLLLIELDINIDNYKKYRLEKPNDSINQKIKHKSI